MWDRRKIHWLKSDELIKFKANGGMGVRDLVMFNNSLMAKHAWQLLQNPDSLFYKVFNAHFFPNG